MADFCTGKRCPKCGGRNCQLISETDYRSGKYGFGKGCCGYILFGLPGLICGLCGMESKSKTRPIGYAPIATISSGHENEKRPICAVALSYEAWCVGRLSPTPRQKLLFSRLAVSGVRKMYRRACRTACRLSDSHKEKHIHPHGRTLL